MIMSNSVEVEKYIYDGGSGGSCRCCEFSCVASPSAPPCQTGDRVSRCSCSPRAPEQPTTPWPHHTPCHHYIWEHIAAPAVHPLTFGHGADAYRKYDDSSTQCVGPANLESPSEPLTLDPHTQKPPYFASPEPCRHVDSHTPSCRLFRGALVYPSRSIVVGPTAHSFKRWAGPANPITF